MVAQGHRPQSDRLPELICRMPRSPVKSGNRLQRPETVLRVYRMPIFLGEFWPFAASAGLTENPCVAGSIPVLSTFRSVDQGWRLVSLAFIVS